MSRVHRPKKTESIPQSKPNQKISIETISLACERFFISRGMPNREPFTGWGKPSPKQEEE